MGNCTRDKFLANIASNVEADSNKIGLKMINVNETDIKDERGYLEALGKEASAKALNEAKKSVAGQDRMGEIGKAIADRERDVMQTDAIKNIKIDKVTVWENGQNASGKNSTANFVSGLYKAVLPLKDIFDMAGMDLPGYLGNPKND